MKKFFFYTLFSISVVGYAQDQLFKKDNTKIDVKILEISQNEIKYKLFTYQDGPIIIVSKKDVALIIYQNGVREVINASSESTAVPIEDESQVVNKRHASLSKMNKDSIKQSKINDLLATKNLISFNVIDPLNGSLSFSYIREFANNYLHIYVPVSVGFAEPRFTQVINTIFSGNNYYYTQGSTNNFAISDFQYTKKTYEVGLGVHFQTSGKKAVTHFVGPYVGIAAFSGIYAKNDFYNPTYGNDVLYKDFTLNRVYIMLDNGLLFRITKNFNIVLLASLGYHIDTYKADDDFTKAANYNRNQLPINAFKAGLSFGYRF